MMLGALACAPGTPMPPCRWLPHSITRANPKDLAISFSLALVLPLTREPQGTLWPPGGPPYHSPRQTSHRSPSAADGLLAACPAAATTAPGSRPPAALGTWLA